MEEEYESEDDSEPLNATDKIPEVNKDNVLNYESDSEDEQGDSSEDLGAKLQTQKEELRMNDTWGKKKKAYYQASSEEDSSQDEEQDQLNEAKRL